MQSYILSLLPDPILLHVYNKKDNPVNNDIFIVKKSHDQEKQKYN